MMVEDFWRLLCMKQHVCGKLNLIPLFLSFAATPSLGSSVAAASTNLSSIWTQEALSVFSTNRNPQPWSSLLSVAMASEKEERNVTVDL